MTSTQLAIRLDGDLLEGLDWLVVRCNLGTRTEVVREAIRRLMLDERRRQIDEQYAAAYEEAPQGDDEVAHLGAQSFDHLDAQDWTSW